eukprot:2563704-Rhodomonas_salina.2
MSLHKCLRLLVCHVRDHSVFQVVTRLKDAGDLSMLSRCEVIPSSTVTVFSALCIRTTMHTTATAQPSMAVTASAALPVCSLAASQAGSVPDTA